VGGGCDVIGSSGSRQWYMRTREPKTAHSPCDRRTHNSCSRASELIRRHTDGTGSDVITAPTSGDLIKIKLWCDIFVTAASIFVAANLEKTQ